MVKLAVAATEVKPPRKKQHPRPCKECPWRQESTAGVTGGNPPEYFAGAIVEGAAIPCHMTINYRDREWSRRWLSGEEGSHCAGAAIMRSNVGAPCKSPTVPTLPADTERVFATLPPFIDHHRTGDVGDWLGKAEADYAWVRDKLGMSPMEAVSLNEAYRDEMAILRFLRKVGL